MACHISLSMHCIPNSNLWFCLLCSFFFSLQFNQSIQKMSIKHPLTFTGGLEIWFRFPWFSLFFLPVYIFLWFPSKCLSGNTLAYITCRIAFSMHCIPNCNLNTSIFQKFRKLYCETDTKYSRLSLPSTSYVFRYVFHALRDC